MPEADPLSVLIVDDDPLALTLLNRHFTGAGYRVFTAANGAEALRILATEGTPILITDWVMPEMDGLELCRAVRAHEGIPFVYIIIVTADQTSDDRLVEAFDAGADDFLCKPYKAKELLVRVRAGERIVKLHDELNSRSREAHRYNAEIEIVNRKLAAANEELNRMATTDELTGLINRREALTRLTDHWAAAQRHGDSLACIALDIDRFKSCNDAYSHAVGDVVLKKTAEIMQAAARRGEDVCRIGGEEFLVICPRSTETMTVTGAERIRQAVEDNVIRCGDLTLRVTISAGVAERTASTKNPDDLLRAADKALYAAKDAGRNVVRLAGTKQEPFTDDDLGTPLTQALSRQGRPDKPTRVLVVDDDESMRVLCRRFLEFAGYQVIEAHSGEEALVKAKRDAPDVVIMDAIMPGMDGLTCTQKLKGDPNTAGIPVVIASSRTDATDIAADLEAGADEYLTKPLNSKELVLRVKTMARLRCEVETNNEVRGEQSRALDLVLDYSRHIAAADSLDSVLERTLDISAAMTCCRRVSIMLPAGGKPCLTVARALGIDKDAAAGVSVPLGTPTSGRVFESRVPTIVGTVTEEKPHGHDPDAPLLAGIPSISTPLCTHECVVGVLNLTGRQGGEPFTPVELEYVDLICNIAASAIHEHLTRRARDEARYSIMVALAKLAEHRDSETGKHVERVSRFACLLAEELRSIECYRAVITDEYIDDLARAVPLHDIGKVAIPDHVLLKPGRLTAEDTAVMRTHTSIGARTLRSIVERVPGARFLAMAEEIAHAHHEWHNGQGYPRGLSGEAIPLSARLVAAADVYDAITTRRVYKEAISHETAVTIITESSGKQFAPDVANAFLKCEEDFRRLAVELADDFSSSVSLSHVDTTPSDVAVVGARP